jgi:hypothetical protein
LALPGGNIREGEYFCIIRTFINVLFFFLFCRNEYFGSSWR